jgi:hypothetical protein
MEMSNEQLAMSNEIKIRVELHAQFAYNNIAHCSLLIAHWLLFLHCHGVVGAAASFDFHF